MFAPFLMEVKEHGSCFSLSVWVPDKTVFVGNSQERRCAPPRTNTNGIWSARHNTKVGEPHVPPAVQTCDLLVTFLECEKWGVKRLPMHLRNEFPCHN